MKKLRMLFWGAAALAVNTSVWLYLNSRAAQIWDENGPMENFQAICLALAALLSLAAAKFAATRGQTIFFATLALFTASILVLEVDFRRMDAPVLNKVMNGRIRDAWLGGLWLIAVVFFVRNMAAVWATFITWLKQAPGIWMVCSGVFWIAAVMIDKSLLGRKDLFREELMEVNGALLTLGSTVLALIAIRSGIFDATPKPERT